MKTVKGENMTAEERHKLLSPEEKRIYWRHQKEKKLYKELVPHFYYARYGQDDAEIKKIELRSEKVRNIIGQVPPVLLRYGIVIIGLSLLMLIGASAFIPYQSGIDTEISVTQDENGLLHFSTVIPQNVVHKVKTRRADSNHKGQKAQFSQVVAEKASELSLPSSYWIENISDSIIVTGNKAWRTLALTPQSAFSAPLQIENTVKISGKILQEKQSVMMWVVGKLER